MIPLMIMAAGTAMQVYGQLRANYDQAQQEIQNAKFYEEQAQFARAAEFRQADITRREYEARKGAQASAFARGGVDVSSGSSAGILAETVAEKAEELTAIQRKGELDFKLARARARSGQAMADSLSDPLNNLMQAGGTILTNYAKAGAPGLGDSPTPSAGGGALGGGGPGAARAL